MAVEIENTAAHASAIKARRLSVDIFLCIGGGVDQPVGELHRAWHFGALMSTPSWPWARDQHLPQARQTARYWLMAGEAASMRIR
jgi:hypothetical protein